MLFPIYREVPRPPHSRGGGPEGRRGADGGAGRRNGAGWAISCSRWAVFSRSRPVDEAEEDRDQQPQEGSAPGRRDPRLGSKVANSEPVVVLVESDVGARAG